MENTKQNARITQKDRIKCHDFIENRESTDNRMQVFKYTWSELEDILFDYASQVTNDSIKVDEPVKNPYKLEKQESDNLDKEVKHAEYTHWKGEVQKDGHTMMVQDIAKELNRKSLLESHLQSDKEEIGKLESKLLSISINDLPEKDREYEQIQAKVKELEGDVTVVEYQKKILGEGLRNNKLKLTQAKKDIDELREGVEDLKKYGECFYGGVALGEFKNDLDKLLLNK